MFQRSLWGIFKDLAFVGTSSWGLQRLPPRWLLTFQYPVASVTFLFLILRLALQQLDPVLPHQHHSHYSFSFCDSRHALLLLHSTSYLLLWGRLNIINLYLQKWLRAMLSQSLRSCKNAKDMAFLVFSEEPSPEDSKVKQGRKRNETKKTSLGSYSSHTYTLWSAPVFLVANCLLF